MARNDFKENQYIQIRSAKFKNVLIRKSKANLTQKRFFMSKNGNLLLLLHVIIGHCHVCSTHGTY